MEQNKQCTTEEVLKQYLPNHFPTTSFFIDDVPVEDIIQAMHAFAKAYAEADRKDCAEKARIIEIHDGDECFYMRIETEEFIRAVDKSSILDRPYPDLS